MEHKRHAVLLSDVGNMEADAYDLVISIVARHIAPIPAVQWDIDFPAI